MLGLSGHETGSGRCCTRTKRDRNHVVNNNFMPLNSYVYLPTHIYFLRNSKWIFLTSLSGMVGGVKL